MEHYRTGTPLAFSSIPCVGRPITEVTFEELKRTLGDVVVNVMRGRDVDAGTYVRSPGRPVPTTLGAFLDEIQSASPSNDFYLTNDCGAFQGPLREFFEQFTLFPGIVRKKYASENSFLFIGPPGSTTTLHHDMCSSLIVQVIGKKRIILCPPTEAYYLHDNGTNVSPVTPDERAGEEFPLFPFAERKEVILSPGTALFIPVGWWHHVEGLTANMSISLANFLLPNVYPIDGFVPLL